MCDQAVRVSGHMLVTARQTEATEYEQSMVTRYRMQASSGKVGEQRNKNIGSASSLKLTASSEEPENHKLEVNSRCLSQRKRSKEVKREEKGRRCAVLVRSPHH